MLKEASRWGGDASRLILVQYGSGTGPSTHQPALEAALVPEPFPSRIREALVAITTGARLQK